MVAVIDSGSSIRNSFNYNDQKVKQEIAACRAAINYLEDAEDLNFYQRLSRLENQAALNDNAKVNFVHIYLNFDPSKKLFAD